MRAHSYAFTLAMWMTWPVSATSVIGHKAEQVIKASGVTEIKDTFDGVWVVIQFRTRTLSPDASKRTDRLPALACTGSRIPCSILEGIEIQVQGKRVFVPKPAFIGLSDIVTAAIFGGKRMYVLRIVGGDASEAYLVSLTFNRDQVLTRKVAPLTEPDAPSEESAFHATAVSD